MKRSIVILSSVLVFAAAAAFAQNSPAQQTSEKLTKEQLTTLIATAKTPAEHTRIAQYYAAQAQNDLAQSQEHEQMAAQFKSNPTTSSSKNVTGTVNHCEYLAQHLKASALQNQKLELKHEQMAREAGQK